MVTVRTAASADIPAIQRVAREAWHAAYGEFVPEPVIEEMLAEWYSDGAVERAVTADEVVYLLAEAGQSVIGYASAGGDPETEPGTAVLSSIYARPDRWGEGVGSALLDAVIGRLRERGHERLRATILADNDVGRIFYDRRGFEQVAEHTEALGDERYDALVVERSL